LTAGDNKRLQQLGHHNTDIENIIYIVQDMYKKVIKNTYAEGGEQGLSQKNLQFNLIWGDLL